MHLEVRERFALRSGNFNLQINVLRISYTIIFYTFLFHFYISKGHKNATGMGFQLKNVRQVMDF